MSFGSAAGNVGVILELRMQEFLRVTASYMIEVDFGIPREIFLHYSISGLKEHTVKSLSSLIPSSIPCMLKNTKCAPSKNCFTSHFYSKRFWPYFARNNFVPRKGSSILP